MVRSTFRWRRWVLVLVGLPLVLVIGGYLSVRQSDAFEAAQVFAAERGLFDPGEPPRLGWLGFRISRSGGSGRAAFDLVGTFDGRARTLSFILERDPRRGEWRVRRVSTDHRRITLYPSEGAPSE